MSSGMPLVNLDAAAAAAADKEYRKRKKAFLKKVQKLELKYALRFATELRANPASIYAQLVVVDLKKVKGSLSVPNKVKN